jgi:hypothetical protein
MLDTPILDVAIGLIFIYLFYSLCAIEIKELVATIFSCLPRMQEPMLKRMLDRKHFSHYWWDKLHNLVVRIGNRINIVFNFGKLADKKKIRSKYKFGFDKISSSFLFICFLFINTSNCLGQQPGGVNGTKIWYITNTVGNKNILNDASGNKGADFASSTGSENLNINFHPSVFFKNRTADKLFKNLLLSQYTVAGIYFPDPENYKGNEFIALTSNRKAVSLQYNSITNGNTKYQYGNKANRTTFELSKPVNLTENSMKTAIYYGASKKLSYSIWKQKEVSSLNSDFNGYIPELIIYNRTLSQNEALRVQTYLSIKYGTTLDTTYVGSDSSILWDINNPVTRMFHHRVCAIGKDSTSGIFQPKSNTTYEEEFINDGKVVNSYWKDADDGSLLSNWKFIPALDSPSLYRSITINFQDKSLKAIGDKSFIFWGDDAMSVKTDQFKTWFADKYPFLKTVQRKWLIYNKGKVDQPFRFALAGGDYGAKTLFNTLYDPYDYQLYRYVLVKFKSLNPLQIDTLQLCGYFGREQINSSHFNTRTIVWENIAWKDTYTYFTIGKVPILNFLQFGKTATSQLIDLKYPYYSDSAIRAETEFDTLASSSKKEFIFKKNEAISAYFRISKAVEPIIPKLFVLSPNNIWSPVNTAITRVGDTTVTTADPREASESSQTIPNDHTEPAPPPVKKKKLEQIDRHRPISKQSYIAYNVSKLQSGKTYKIVITDGLMQKTSIPFKIIVK